uniref:Transglutaminase domain-containing protein n=1 Tax=Sphingobacterium sp. (strain 21) TaxID=743722 RepID=F4C9T2_SPHS2
MLYKFLLYFILTVILLSCTSTPLVEDDIFNTPDFGNNSAKRSAYEFLTANLTGLSHVSEYGNLIYDTISLNRDYLIENLESAIRSSEPLRKANLIGDSEFQEYILPYRVNASRIMNWRKEVWKKYDTKEFKDIQDEKSLIDCCNKINDRLRQWFVFGSLQQLEDTLTYSHINHYKKGSCISMANLAAYTLRAMGAPIAIDFVPAWGNVPGGHVWNSLVLKGGKFYPFQGAESNILSYEPLYLVKSENNEQLSTYRRPPKVYRKTFSIQKESVYYKQRQKLPQIGLTSRMIDVTRNYVPVSTIIIKADELMTKPENVFINVYNNGLWVPVMVVEAEHGEYIFKDLGNDLLYSVTTYNKVSFEFINLTFYLDKSGNMIKLNPSFEKKIDVNLHKIRSIEMEQLEELKKGWDVDKLLSIAEEKTYTIPTKNRKYNLYYWQNKWIKTGISKLKSGNVSFKEVPSNALYLFSEGKPSNKDRPFILYKNQIKWL